MDSEQRYRAYIQSEQWKAIVKKRLEIDGNACVMCGSRGTTLNPLECHHLRYKGVLYHENEGDNIYTQLCTLCHTCHKLVHNLMCRKTAPDRNGWKDRYDIPKISVFTIAGETLESKEVGKV